VRNPNGVSLFFVLEWVVVVILSCLVGIMERLVGILNDLVVIMSILVGIVKKSHKKDRQN